VQARFSKKKDTTSILQKSCWFDSSARNPLKAGFEGLVDKPLDIHRVHCAEPVLLSTG
jgi:hypothetical protein